jgi:NAD dependent epimerase/dehydratase
LKVLVTGADGFIGSHLVETLLAKGCEVRALALYNSFNSWGWLDNINRLKDIEVVTGDVRDPFLCNKITDGVDIVFNLAALIAIPYSYEAPQSYVETNINGALNICQASMKNKVRRVVQVSTSEVYGTAQYVPIDEKHPLQPQSPYSASKIGSDALAMSFYNSFDLPVSVARPFNTFGPRQSARAVIPTIISQIASGQKKMRLGDLTPTRDFNFVADTCEGLWLISQCGKAVGDTINIGSGEEHSIGDTAKTLQRILGKSIEIEEDQVRLRPKNSEVHRLLCDNKKITALTGYKPRFSFEDGLRQTVDWFSNPENLKRYKTDIYNV